MPRIEFDTSEVVKGIKRMERIAPLVLDKQMRIWLTESAEEVRKNSVMLASQEAKGVTSNYMNSFRVSPIKGSVKNRHIIVSNQQPYSLVIEYGGIWRRKMPPPSAFYEWVRKKLNPRPKARRRKVEARRAAVSAEVRNISFAIAMSYLKKGKAGKKARKALKIMNRGLEKATRFIQGRLGFRVEQGLRKL